MKIMFLNLQYGLGLDGSFGDFLRHFYRYFYCSRKVEVKAVDALKDILWKERPDVLLLTETYLEHLKDLVNEGYAYFDVGNKYGPMSLLRKIPGFRRRSNGFLANGNFNFDKHYLKNGVKKLIYEIKINEDLGLFMGHFSLSGRTRKKQFDELKKIAGRYKKVILCGDFNIFSGYEELESLIKELDLKIVAKQEHKTYPAYNPKHHMDLFLCSKDLKIKGAKVLREKLSDHLPVILEV